MLEVTYYTFEKEDKKHIVAVCKSDEGIVRGEAICSPNDTYNEDFGKALAKKKCLKKHQANRVKNLKKTLDANTEAAIFFSNLARANSEALAKATSNYQNTLQELQEMSELGVVEF